MTVINTSPAIHLHAALPGGIASLTSVIGDIIIPWEVSEELAAGLTKDTTWQEIHTHPLIIIRPAPIVVHPLLSSQIDLGEAAVIQTALDEGHLTVILDDLKARRIALTLGLSVTGTLGILLQAKAAAQLPSIRDAIAILEKRGMWLAPALIAKAISLAGEK